MRNFKTKSIFLNILLAMLCVCAIFVFSTPIQIDRVLSAASCVKGDTIEKGQDVANDYMDTGEDYGGKIPFSLFLSRADGNSRFITDYYPSFTATEPADKEKDIYYYIMDESSRPSFLLSSKEDSGKDELYNTTIFFKFNDSTAKGIINNNGNTIPNESGFLSVTATVNGEPIIAEIDTSTNSTTKEASYLFAVNLQSLINDDGSNNLNAQCPEVRNTTDSNTSYLGGNGEENDVSRRTGLYNFHIEYSYREVTSYTSNKCVFEMSFYVLDYDDYVKDDNPFNFSNTDTVRNNQGVDLNYEIYNYNYLDTPKVEFDATKFGINFVYTAGFSNYSMVYNDKSFSYNYTPNTLDTILNSTSGGNLETTKQQILNGTLATGQINILLKNSTDIAYTIKTYYKEDQYGIHYYIAKFDLKDFENFLVRNKSTFNSATTMQGTYHFDLDFLGQTDVGYSVIDKSLFTDIPSKISGQKLVIFGYELKYYDQNPNSNTYHQDVTLINENTHTNFVSYNSMTDKTKSMGLDTGFLVNIPSYIAITDQAPLRFHSFGNLTGGSGNYSADYRCLDYLSTTEDDVLKYFIFDSDATFDSIEKENKAYIDSIINKAFQDKKTYTQGASISGDGIWVMKLEYKVSLPLTADDGTYLEPVDVAGYQFVVFEINNTVQNLYIQGFDGSSNTSYDFDTYTNKDVRVNLEQKPNTFFAPVNVTYYYSNDFKRENITASGKLNLKLSNNNIYTYIISDNKEYGYYVTDQNNNYTFRDSGYYKIVIRSVVSNVPKTYSFIIDKESFTNVSLNQVKFQDDNYIKSATVLQDKYLSNSSNYLNYDLYVTNTGFTLGWKEKRSGASSYNFVYYMEITDDTLNNETSLFDIKNGEFWLTNGLKTKNLSSAIDTYRNSINVPVKDDARLEYNQYFNKDGLYFFYVFDDAGNYFTRIILIDSSSSSTLQGYWDKVDNNDVWVDTFDPVDNPANYVNHDTTIYFGTHKAILLPDLSQNVNLSIEDISFTRAYDLKLGELIAEKPKINIDFNNQVLLKLTDYIKTTTFNSIIGTSKAGNYLTLRNNIVEYEKTPTTVDLETEEVIGEIKVGNITEIYQAEIFTLHDESNYDFVGEAEYMFRVTNLNGAVTGKYICMNFDVVQGTFYGYGNNQGENTEHIIRKNGATNLKNMKFEYKKITDETANYYKLAKLSYDFYEFVLDESSKNSSKNSYPFASSPTASSVDMLSSQLLDSNRNIYMIDPINIDTSGLTRAGKYIVTRTYVGGTHNYDAVNDIYVPTPDGTGGKYYQNEEGAFIDLFELDTITRKYIVYVDHNGIITSTYMVRNDKQEGIREVGDKISITLSSKYDDEWNFKEFFLTSTATLSLDTNKVPIQINIPLSKYFVYYNTINDSLYSKLNFAKLDITIYYQATKYTERLSYKIDGYDNTTGLCTCSKLISSSNTKGYLIFRASGQYTIEINDRTGYIDITSTSANSNNLFPTTYSYSFEISHSSPYANMYTETYNTQKNTFETNLLYNNDNSNNFATNIKKSNENNLHDNSVTINWNDAVTPYSAKVNQINIEVLNGTSRQRIEIDLKNYDLLSTAKGSNFLSLTNIPNSNYIIHLKVSFFEGVSEPVIYDNTEYYRFAYELSLDITEEYRYNITFSYVSKSSKNQSYLDENGNSYAESLYTLTIDRTKPNTNIDALLSLSSEEFLNNYYTNDNINNFKEENFNPFNIEKSPSAFTYTFGVNNNYTLNYNEEDTMSYFFVRSYDKYDSGYISITPDMVDTVYPTSKAYYTRFSSDENNYGFGIEYPRFAEVGLENDEINISNYKWHKVNYDTKTPLYTLIANATKNANPTGFYEVIERDFAGNYRAYTVYFTEFANNKNFLTLNIDGYNEQGYSKVDNESDSNITARLMFEITELSSSLGWGKVTVKNETLDAVFDETIFFNPYDSSDRIQTRLDKLNNFFKCEFDSRYSITLAKYNSSFPAITRYINIITNESTAKLPAPTIEERFDASTNSTVYNLVFPAYTTKSVLYLEKLSLHVLQGTNWNIVGSYEGKTSIPEKITNLSKGIYKATYNDNYNKENSYSYIIYVGEYYINDFNKEYTFEHDSYVYDETENIYYSGGDINVTYEGNIYSVWVNGINYSGTSYEKDSPTLSNHNCKTFTLSSDYIYDDIAANEKVGGSTYYNIVYRDITDNSIQKVYNFTVFNELPNIVLLNAYGGEITSTLEESTSQVTSSIVTINWGNIENCDFDLLNDSADNQVSVARLFTKNQNGEYKNSVSINKGQTISEEGYYKLQIINSKLGNYREIYFVILLGDFPLYTVTVDKQEIEPSKLETLDLTTAKTSSGEILINTLYSALKMVMENEGQISDFNSLKNQLGFKDDIFNISNVGICSLNDIPHYYSIKDPKIVYNSNMELNIVEFVFMNDIIQTSYMTGENPTPNNVGRDYWTTFYLVYNLKGPIRIEFFAITKTPKNNTLLTQDLSYLNENDNIQSTISIKNNKSGYQLYYPQIKSGAVTLSWNKLSTASTAWYNQGNIIRVFDKYGVAKDFSEVDYKISSYDNNLLTSSLIGSGSHQIKFQDIAGNVQLFDIVGSYQQIEYYTLDLIDSVIYHVNYNEQDYNPIQYGVFNDELNIVIDKQYLQYYLNNKPNVSVTRNGVYYNGYEIEDNIYKFKRSGRYVIEFSGAYEKTSGMLKTTTYSFTILDSNSARLAYEFVEVMGYEIVNVTRNGEDITDNFRDKNGKILSLFISSASSSSGNGNYSITLKYGKNENDILTFTFTINDYIPTISCNVEYGGATTGSILISFNPSIIYEQLGECYIKVLTYNNDSKTFYQYTTFTIDENSFVDASARTIEITRSNSYFVQVETKNGNILSSFRVNRNEPLNTFAIIIIVIAVLAVIALIIIIVKLRTKMKIK